MPVAAGAAPTTVGRNPNDIRAVIAANPRDSGAWRWRLAAAALLALGAAGHVWFLVVNCPFDLSGDEAHYWEWSRRLDISYYSKGPLVAYIIAAGRWLLADWSQRLVGSEALAVRLPAVLLGMATGMGIFELAQSTLRRPRLAFASVALTFTVPIMAAGSMLMTIDAPLVCLSTWALVIAHRAVMRDSAVAWLATGLLIALGVLAKYNMLLLLPAVGLFILCEPSRRRLAARPMPYAAAVVGLFGLIPIGYWNARHDWVSLRHVAGQAGVSGRPSFDGMGIAAYAAGQAAVIGAVWFAGILLALREFHRRPGAVIDPPEQHDPRDVRFLVFAAVTPFAVFLLFSPLTKIQPNWPVMGLPPALILLAAFLARRLSASTSAARRGWMAFTVTGAVLGGGVVAIMHRTEWLYPLLSRWTAASAPWDLTPMARYDPAARLRGWAELGAAVGQVLAEQEKGGRRPFILADDYQTASEIAFYCPGNPDVYCAQSALGRRLNQYDFWPGPISQAEAFIGRPVIYVGALEPRVTGDVRLDGEPPASDSSNGPPARISSAVGDSSRDAAVLSGARLARTVRHAVGGHTLRLWTILTADRFNGFAVEDQAIRRY